MPHAIIEYSGNIEEDVLSVDLCDLVHGLLIECGLFNVDDIKTRSYVADDFMVGEKGQDGSFIHVTISLLEGRTSQQKKTLAQTILDSIAEAVEEADSISVDVREMAKEIYVKTRKEGVTL
jgi:5-carboxymethyl-2-hydroxymuconate isomerase